MSGKAKKPVAYLAVRYDDGTPTGLSVQPDREKAEEFLRNRSDEEEEPDSAADPKDPSDDEENENTASSPEEATQNPLSRIIDRISEVMMSYYALINISSMAREIFLTAFLETQIVRPLSKGGAELLESTDQGKLFALERAGISKVAKGREQVRRIDNGTAAMPASTLMSMVAAFDSIIADLVGVLLKARREKLNVGERTVSLAEVLASSSVDEILDRFVTNEVYELLRGSHDDQVKFIEKNFDIEIRTDWRGWADFIEVFERRNLLAHGEAKFTARYAEICRRHGKSINIRKPGETIELRRQYLRHAADTLLEFGVLLAFSLWRKHFKDEEEEAFSALNQVAYQFVVEDRLSVAINILRYATGIKTTNCSDFTRRMMIVNLANAWRKMKKPEDAEKVLSSVDWSATSNYFQICVAAVRDDLEGVVSRMESVKAKVPGEDQKISSEAFRDWPVFDKVRNEDRFRAEFERIFKEPLLTEVSSEASAEDDESPPKKAATRKTAPKTIH